MTILIFVVPGLAIGTFFVGRAGNQRYTHIRPRRAVRRHERSSVINQRAFWRLYLNDLPDPCSGHKPFWLTAADDGSTAYLCQRCTKDLPSQSWMHCSACVYTAAPGFVAHDPCTNLREATGPWS
jgi:hypothetical protein